MSRTLASLLGPVYGGALAPEHLADLRKSGLTDETIQAQYIRSVPPCLIPRLLGFDVRDVQSALLFPFRSPAGGFMDHVRIKVFPALTDRKGHTLKYLQRRGSAPRLYFVGSCIDEVLHGSGPLWLVEGEKKSLAVAQVGLPAVGFCGVQGWHTRGTRELLPEFAALRLEGRLVQVVPDGDYETNPDVQRAVRRCADALRARGAQPRRVVVPAPVEVPA
jgi:uncharacterized protein DUF3854